MRAARGRGLHLAAAPRPEGRGPASPRRWRLLAPERALHGVRRTREAGRERAPAAAGAGGGGGGGRRGEAGRALWRRRLEPGRSGARGRGRAERQAEGSEPQVQFPTTSPEFVDGAARRRLRLKESSGGGGAEAAEVRAGELLGPPRRSGNGLRSPRPAGVGAALLLVAERHAGTPARPAPSAPGSGGRGAGAARRRGLLGAPALPARKRRALPGPWLRGAGGPERGNVPGPCCRPPRLAVPTRSLARPGLGGLGLGARDPLRAQAPTPLRREWR